MNNMFLVEALKSSKVSVAILQNTVILTLKLILLQKIMKFLKIFYSGLQSYGSRFFTELKMASKGGD